MKKPTTLQQIKDILLKLDRSQDDKAKAAVVRSYWDIGKLALAYQDETGMIIKDIARELSINKTALQRYTQFYKTYRNGYPEKYYDKVINWSLFYIVLPVHDKKAREFYLKQACKENWDKYELIRRIKDDFFSAAADKYAKGIPHLKDKDQQLYTYKAEVLKVVDGDTLDLKIDVGFKSTQEHRVRLRGINCPELSTKKGVKARDFVVEELRKCVVPEPIFAGGEANRSMVVVKTYKRGMYGRYLADIYYLPKENKADVIAKKGKLLNQVLLDEGLARKVE